jgi:hypothetical protein
MSVDDFDQPRAFSDAFTTGGQVPDEPYDLISFLAVAQSLKINFLPLTWETARQQIGLGGTSRVSQTLVNASSSYAFKRVAAKQIENETEDRIFQILINELVALSHPATKRHPHVTELFGISWEVPLKKAGNINDKSKIEEKAWPVLVFEKTDHGDLNTFLTSPAGRESSFVTRRDICTDVCSSIADMHRYSKFW